jgi:hypothetical protein
MSWAGNRQRAVVRPKPNPVAIVGQNSGSNEGSSKGEAPRARIGEQFLHSESLHQQIESNETTTNGAQAKIHAPNEPVSSVIFHGAVK